MTIQDTRTENTYDGVSFLANNQGTVDGCTITGSADTGVYITSTAQPTVKNSVIDNSTTNGIYCYTNANVTIEADTVSNAPTGLYCLVQSSPTIQLDNWIKDNTVGIKCEWWSDAVIRESKITGNNKGVVVNYSSEPDLGTASGPSCTGAPGEGGNSIHSNTTYDVENLTTTTISAQCNYWGGYPPSPLISGDVDYTPAKDQNPFPTSGFPGYEEPGEEEEKTDTAIPLTYALSHAYPNPFNPTTQIRYQVPAPGSPVTMIVYNIKGQPIRTLLNEQKDPGFYVETWDGRNGSGETVASGIYFVRMVATGFTETKKIVLLK